MIIHLHSKKVQIGIETAPMIAVIVTTITLIQKNSLLNMVFFPVYLFIYLCHVDCILQGFH